MNNNDELELEIIAMSIKMNANAIKLEALQKELELELVELSFQIADHAAEIDEFNEDCVYFKREAPYGTVVHFTNNVSIFYPWEGPTPSFRNAIGQKIVYAA